jgi:hypothetical protein
VFSFMKNNLLLIFVFVVMLNLVVIDIFFLMKSLLLLSQMSKNCPKNTYDVQFWNKIFDVELPKYKNQLEDIFS